MRNTYEYIRNNGTTGIAVWENENEQSCRHALNTLFANEVPLETLRRLDFGNLNVDKEFNEFYEQPE